MKLFVASDIHGSEFYCRKMIEAFYQEKADKLLLLGDILYHGPRNNLPKDYNPKAVIEMLNKEKKNLICVRGNCDTDVDQMVLDFPILANYTIVLTENETLFLTHGHIYSKENLPPLNDGDVFLYGHTHVPCFEKISSIYCINPGSVSIPKENSHHGYLIIKNNKYIFKDLDGNVICEHQKE